jgi:deazaflavin-dependent oxidoreductase (nitroreductase family)
VAAVRAAAPGAAVSVVARPAAIRPSSEAVTDLPYGPFLRRSLPAISRAFRILNRVYVIPAIKAGLGPLHANPLTGSWMLLRTTGRRSGLPREVALGYAILDGSVYVSAGFGPRTAWYRNLVADPRVEIILPAGRFAGIAEPVTDPEELDRAWRALIRALGILGRAFVCGADARPSVLAASTAGLPLVRIRTVGLAGGRADPASRAWVVVGAVGLAWLVWRLASPRGGRPTVDDRSAVGRSPGAGSTHRSR